MQPFLARQASDLIPRHRNKSLHLAETKLTLLSRAWQLCCWGCRAGCQPVPWTPQSIAPVFVTNPPLPKLILETGHLMLGLTLPPVSLGRGTSHSQLWKSSAYKVRAPPVSMIISLPVKPSHIPLGLTQSLASSVRQHLNHTECDMWVSGLFFCSKSNIYEISIWHFPAMCR